MITCNLLPAPVKIGIIGCGNVLEAYLPQCDRLRSKGWAEVALVCGRDHQKQRALALGAPAFTNDEQAFFRHDLDLVLVLASMPEHGRLTRAALEAGKHVLVEKPLSTSLAEAEALIALAARKQRLLLCAPFTVLSPTFQTIARRIDQGDIGRPCLARARYGWAGPWWAEWFYKNGGGCIFDLAVYCITTLTGFLGPARRVCAMAGVAIPERNVNGRAVQVESEDNAQITLDFGGNTFGTIMSGFTMQQYRAPAVEIYGQSGVIQMLGDDWDPDGYELFQNSAGCWQLYKETDPEWSWTDGLRHAVECLRERRPPLVTPEHALHTLEIMLKAREAAASGKTIEIASRFAPPRAAAAGTVDPVHLQHDRTREHISLKIQD